jgi:hypothetical protein
VLQLSAQTIIQVSEYVEAFSGVDCFVVTQPIIGVVEVEFEHGFHGFTSPSIPGQLFAQAVATGSD